MTGEVPESRAAVARGSLRVMVPTFSSTEKSVISSRETVTITNSIMFYKTGNFVLYSSNAIRLLALQIPFFCTFGC